MITKDNFKNVLEKLGFEKKSNIYTKNFNEFKTKLKVDFKNEKLIYPEEQGMTISQKQTCNFSDNENFVVFECVHRLLNQGYNPKHIELEQTYSKIKKDDGGGRADIIIKDNDDKVLLIIECKTYGKAFDGHWKKTLHDGDQLFRYLTNKRETQFLCMYCSSVVDNKIVYPYHLISLKDNETYLENNKDLLSFKDAKTKNKEDIFKVWCETYQQYSTTTGLFEDTQAYKIGKDKYSINDLKIVSSNNIKGKYNEFATIMRQHNIGGAERAFNVLVNLFLCKIIDENKNIKNDKSGLEFYWKGVSYDDAFSLQDRLQELYKVGMFDFLNEKITYISDNDIDKMFTDLDILTIQREVKSKFREQKFFTNNDFSFLDVHSKELFYKNFEVLLKVVEMFQDIRLTGVEDNQFLGDMFEGFLDNGVKQSEGQFFTPMPIVKFIINSLPLDTILKTHNEAKAIDFACGSGHFLNEVAKVFTSNEVVGIEKEYRLSKVAKVSALMYGQENINIVYNDALTQDENIANDSFSVLVANPPYSVKGFLRTLSQDDIETYALTKTIDEKSHTANNSIECFFIEKAKQILCSDAVVGMVLPSSILSKGDGANTYVGTREILLKYFEIIAIAEFGSGTFGKTGTNTVTLFLKRRDDNKLTLGIIKDFVDNLFIHNKDIGNKLKNKNLIENYCTHIDIDTNIYLSMFENELNQELFKHETFTEYKIEFEKSTLTKNRKNKTHYKALSKEKKEEKEALELLKYIKNIESDKLYYFCLASETSKEVLIIKAPSDGKANKKFLGYEWSGRKGNEGIQYSGGTLGNINTPLYNPNDKDDESKINSFIAKNFISDIIEIPQELEKFVSKAKLVDMLDFSRKEFNKAINLVPKKENIKINSKWELISLGENCENITKGTTPTSIGFNFENNGINFIKIESINLNGEFDKTKFAFINDECNKKMIRSELKENDILFSIAGALGRTAIVNNTILPANTNQAIAIIRLKKDTLIDNNYLYLILRDKIIQDQMEFLKIGVAQQNLSLTQIMNFKIPLPPLNIQKEIVKECETVDENLEKINKEIEDLKKKVKDELNNINSDRVKIESVSKKIFAGGDKPKNFSDIKTNQLSIPIFANSVKEKGLYGFTDIVKVSEECVTVSARGTIGYAVARNENFFPIVRLLIIVPNSKKIYSKYMEIILNSLNIKGNGAGVPQLTVPQVSNIKIPLPSLKTQKEIVEKIEKLEVELSKSQKVIDEASSKKQAILRKYL